MGRPPNPEKVHPIAYLRARILLGEKSSEAVVLAGYSNSGFALAGVYQAHRDHCQGSEARQEEIVSATQLNKVRKVAADKGWICGVCLALHNKPAGASVISEQRIFVVAKMGIIAVLNPLLLHEFELP